MPEKRLDRMEESITKLNNAVTEFLITDAGRIEREKHFMDEITELKENARVDREMVLKFISTYIERHKPVVNKSRYLQSQGGRWLSWVIGALLLSLLVIGGKPIIDKYQAPVEKSTTSSGK